MVMLCILGAPGPFPGYQEVVVTGIVPPYTYPLVGTNAAEQFESVRLLAQQMQQGQQSLVTNIDQILDFDKENMGPDANELVVNQLFSQSDGLFYMDTEVCVAADGSTLLDVLEMAGEALAAIL